MAKAPRKSTSEKPVGPSQRRSIEKQATPIKPPEVEIISPEDGELDSVLGPHFEPEMLDSVGEITIDPDHEIEADDVVPTRAVNAEVIDNRPERGLVKSQTTNKRAMGTEAASADAKGLVTTADPIATYLAEIRKYPLLTKEQEQELAIRYRETGDPKAAEMLVTSNLRFVVKVAAEYSRFGAKLIDLIQEGNVGLMHAVKEFNPYKGVRLITYAVWWIRGYIQEYMMRQYSMVRIGTTQNQRKLFYRLQKEKNALDAAGIEPNVALLAGRLGVTEDEVVTMSKRLSGRDVSLNQPIDGDSSTASLLDFEASPDQGVDDQIGMHEELEVLRENLEKIRSGLSEKELFILEKRLLAEEPLTLQEIGDHYKVTREAIRQIEARLLGKIRTAVTESLSYNEPSNEE